MFKNKLVIVSFLVIFILLLGFLWFYFFKPTYMECSCGPIPKEKKEEVYIIMYNKR